MANHPQRLNRHPAPNFPAREPNLTPDHEIIRLRAENSRLLAVALVREVDGLRDTAVTDLAATLLRDHGLSFVSGRPIFAAGGDLGDAVAAARIANPHYFSQAQGQPKASTQDARGLSAAARLALANGTEV